MLLDNEALAIIKDFERRRNAEQAACKSISTEALEAGVIAGMKAALKNATDALIKTRQQFQAAWFDGPTRFTRDANEEAITFAEAALALLAPGEPDGTTRQN